MPSFIKLRTDKTLVISQSRWNLGQRRPSVFGATLYNQQLGLSSEFELFAATDLWMESVDNGSYVGALLVDLSKAFDTCLLYTSDAADE